MKEINRFCLSYNLEKYFSLSNIDIKEWQLFALLEPFGFTYKLNHDNSLILNGLKGESSNLLENCIINLNLKKIVDSSSVTELINTNSNYLIFVDDYYLPHSRHFNKLHNKRFVLLEYDKNCGNMDFKFKLFDLGYREINLQILNRSFCSAFRLEWNKPFNQTEVEKKIQLLISELFKQNSYSDILNHFYKYIIDFKRENKNILREIYFWVNGPSGPSNTRLQFAEVISHLLTHQKDSTDFQNLYNTLDELANHWEIFGNLLFKFSIEWSDTFSERMGKKLANIIKIENNLYKII